VDFELLGQYVGDDPALLAEVVEIFLDDAPKTLESAARAIALADAGALEMAAHRMKGSLLTLGAASAAETASLLESKGDEGVLSGAAELCERLRRELDEVINTLRAWQGR
jgi:HPt (histidine-containing phosphotransfer) domain-containing protein